MILDDTVVDLARHIADLSAATTRLILERDELRIENERLRRQLFKTYGEITKPNPDGIYNLRERTHEVAP